jgi:hypothetical protein
MVTVPVNFDDDAGVDEDEEPHAASAAAVSA